MTTVTSISTIVGSPIHVVVRNANTGAAVDPSSVMWSGLPLGTTVTINGDGFDFNSSVAANFNATAQAAGMANGVINIAFKNPPLAAMAFDAS